MDGMNIVLSVNWHFDLKNGHSGSKKNHGLHFCISLYCSTNKESQVSEQYVAYFLKTIYNIYKPRHTSL